MFQKALHPDQRYISLREAPPASTMKLNYQAFDSSTSTYNKKIQQTTIDSSGFINPSLKNNNGNYNIYFLGGSTTACFEVIDHLKFVNLVQHKLAIDYQFQVNTYNAGYPGNSSLSSYNKLLNVILPQQPEMVVMMHNFNDLIIMLYQGDYWSTKAKQTKMRKKVELLSDKSLTFYPSYLKNHKKEPFYKLRDGLNELISSFKDKNEGEWRENKQVSSEIDIRQLESDFKSSLLTYIYSCRIYGAKPVLMTQANFFLEDPPLNSAIHQFAKNILQGTGYSYHKIQLLYSNFNQIIKEVAAQEKVTLIDLEKSIPKDSSYLLDMVHLNQKGSQLAAKIISQELAKIIPTTP